MKMKKTITFIFLSMLAVFLTMESFAGYYYPRQPKDDEVAIFNSGVAVPLNKILLIRKDANYCAVKFTSCWTEVDEKELKDYAEYIAKGGDLANRLKELAEKKFALYESFYQGDGTSDFTNKNVQVIKDKASWLPLKGRSRFTLTQPGNPFIKFGPNKLTWEYKTFVGFMPPDKLPGDFGFELAPTPWTDLKEVNINDPRLKWYRYMAGREMVIITIDKLWGK